VDVAVPVPVPPVVVCVGVTAAVISVVMLTEQVSTLPPGLAVPLHWSTVMGMAGLTKDVDDVVQRAVPHRHWPSRCTG